MISRAIDNDDPAYTVASFAAFSFLFLGGLQLSYQTTFISMIVVYAVMSLGDCLRIVLAFMSANSLSDVVQTSRIVHSKLRSVQATLHPSNVYEDLGRGKTIIVMVFFTQVLLIAFVCVDVYDSQTTSCRDGSSGCPVVGTFGSYGFYVLGYSVFSSHRRNSSRKSLPFNSNCPISIFMACVYLLGPKTAFGQSEQNPAYWIQLLIAAKQSGAEITWYDPVSNRSKSRSLYPNDWRVWARFFMSYVINGVGFHILVHALPIQVATQSSLTGVVFRAVGMMYLVDLDDSSGYTLTIVEQPLEPEVKPDDKKEEESPEDNKPMDDKPANVQSEADLAMMSDEAQRIIGEAQEKLNALARGDYTQPNKGNNAKFLAGGALAAGAILTAGELANAQTGNTQDEGDAVEGGVEGGDGGMADASAEA
ncbi:MAG: hypothetical protein SGILL_002146 [Bacillariaceae sp.]